MKIMEYVKEMFVWDWTSCVPVKYLEKQGYVNRKFSNNLNFIKNLII